MIQASFVLIGKGAEMGDRQRWLRAGIHVIELFARYGYAMKSLVYFTAGLLTLQFALGIGGEASGSSDALKAMLRQPMGSILLAIVTVGLVGYSLWRLIQALLDPNHDDKAWWKKWGRRFLYFCSSGAYASLAWSAVEILFNRPNGSSISRWIAMVLYQPWGRWMVLVLGGIVVICGFIYAMQVFKPQFRDKLNLEQVHRERMGWALQFSRFGWLGRGSVYMLVGFYFADAAWHFDAEQAKDSAGAMRSLQNWPWGDSLLFAISLGMILYSLQMLVESRYRPMTSIDVLHRMTDD